MHVHDALFISSENINPARMMPDRFAKGDLLPRNGRRAILVPNYGAAYISGPKAILMIEAAAFEKLLTMEVVVVFVPAINGIRIIKPLCDYLPGGRIIWVAALRGIMGGIRDECRSLGHKFSSVISASTLTGNPDFGQFVENWLNLGDISGNGYMVGADPSKKPIPISSR